ATLTFAKPDSDQHYSAALHSDDKGGEVVVRLEVTPTAGCSRLLAQTQVHTAPELLIVHQQHTMIG
ncbi:MAG: hypothetical protein QGG54_17120, partial [Gammaproteobacteria bacterium]|nr:hypothetical protein [Gammaproteobacteria bacterium]